MLQEFLDAMSGKSQQPAVDPKDMLIDKERLGDRPYLPVFYGAIVVGVFSLVVTLTSVYEIAHWLIALIFVALIMLLITDIMMDYRKHNHMTRARLATVVIFYSAIALVIGFLIALISVI
ncbi:hypothetical protein ACQ4M3_01220 [Leptolyngbya sp. AN03gr2]|uniref:hypothetical protein n=1 Tax=unclassified Leptolyngbya TaxID=2650499 RepID=UPI003D314BC7